MQIIGGFFGKNRWMVFVKRDYTGMAWRGNGRWKGGISDPPRLADTWRKCRVWEEGGENRHQMPGQRTKKGEGEMERAMTSPGVYGQMPFWADDNIVLKKKKAFIAHQCAMHKRYLVRGDSPEKWTDAARRKRGWRELKRMERGSALLPSGRVQAADGNTRPDVLISSSDGTHPPDSSS